MTLTQHVVAALERRIVDGSYAAGVKLPTEPELAEEFSASRTTIRSAVADLQARGLVSREQGRGTFVRGKGRVSINMLLETNLSVTTLIHASGRRPGTVDLSVTVRPGPQSATSALRLAAHTPLVIINRTRTADGLPVACSSDYLVNAPSLPTSAGAYRNSIYELLERVHGRPVTSGLARIEPGRASGQTARRLSLDEDDLLLVLSQVHELVDGTPVMYSVIWLRSDSVHLYVHRGESLTDLSALTTPTDPALD